MNKKIKKMARTQRSNPLPPLSPSQKKRVEKKDYAI
jgi:hypothetical protein